MQSCGRIKLEVFWESSYSRELIISAASFGPVIDDSSSKDADFIPEIEPNVLRSLVRVFGPRPGIWSSADWVRSLDWSFSR